MWASSDVLWGTRIQYSVLPFSPSQQCRRCTGKSKPRNRRKPVFQSWMGNRTRRFLLPALRRDDEKIARCSASYYLASNLFFGDCHISPSRIPRNSHVTGAFQVSDQVVEEPWLMQPSLVSHHFDDTCTSSDIGNESEKLNCSNGSVQNSETLNESSHGGDSSKYTYNVNGMDILEQSDSLLTNYMVEEPWIFESVCSRVKEASGVLRSELGNDEVTQIALSEPHQPTTPENLVHEEENNETTKEDSVSTVILINSSICTVQRIAVLENNKLVELLLEPVKNNVQCDSVYLGVVTKLVPHMGGAFVNIGSPRPSFMDIRPNKGPFVFPKFCGPMEETEVISSTSDKPEEHVDFPENGALSTAVEELDEEDDDQSEDELVNDEFELHGNQANFDVLDILKENLNGSIVEHGVDVEKPKFGKHLNGEAEQLQSRSQPQDASIKIKENKWEQVKRGSKIIVQVIKEGLGTKGPTLTAYPKLRSRFWVLMTCCKTIGISKKISGVERTRLRLIAKTLQPPGFGLTVRTVASGHSLEELQRDLEGLLSTWKNIVDDGKSAALAADEGVEGAVPVMLHRAMGQTLSVVQDYFNEKVESMVVDSPRTYHEVTNYLQDIAPDLCDRVELYSERTPLFDKYNIEEEINSILTKRVPLDNGGYLVIEQTEALVSIDVNGGHCMLGQGTSQEKAILEVNLAAAKQIARESRLRDIGGIIVVDFIDMVDDSNKRLVYEEVKKAVERDRSTVKVSELSRNGLMEITRKRVRPSVTFMISEPCICCQATGRVEALETSFSKIEHEICRLLSTMDQKADPEKPKSWPRFILRVDRHMCNYLTSGKRTRLAVLSSSLKVWILLKVARGLNRGAFELKLLTDEASDKGQCDSAAISVLRPKEVSPPRVTLFPIKNWKTGRK
ncbi:ribonuclease E/G-like protein, chloroplastic isoform X1 [Salvia hispanica]|uniref:ribonuclease E/G-like protein, chloroplastic isoform X1 n=2 Tax=Salvia hispanica TaxID=49212 RepID=UPI00200924E1|nr:ribonuclease E/G-like protein, chloroplastic isoform X1 [Salvia hispanica]